MALTDTLVSRDALRRAVLEDLRDRAVETATTLEDGGPLDGLRFLSLATLDDLIASAVQVPLPPPSEKHAEVITPAKVMVAAVCPECHLPAGILVTLTPQLVVDDDGAELKVKATSKARIHVCHQLPLPEADQGTLDAAIVDLRREILTAVATVTNAFDEAVARGDIGTPPTLDAVAIALEIQSESERADLEDSLSNLAQPDDETAGWSQLVEISTAKGRAPHYQLTPAGVAYLILDAIESADDEAAA